MMLLIPLALQVISVGWHDEFNANQTWKPLVTENSLHSRATFGSLALSLNQVPKNWPYEYQWNGVTADVKVNLLKYPVLMARVDNLQGYAHVDLDVLDGKGKSLISYRSSTLTSSGIAIFDTKNNFMAGTYDLRLRLILGGPNSGCSATYKWVRFVAAKDVEFLKTHPDFQDVKLDSSQY